MKPIYVTLFFLSFFSQFSNAQKAILSSGGYASGSGGSVSYSMGEPMYTHFSNSVSDVNQGIQQPEINVRLSIKVILSGPYDIALGLMRDSLRIKNVIPLVEPYSAPPLNRAVILESSGETITSGILSINNQNSIVDWVFIELRAANNPVLIVATKRALLQRDGDVVSNTDGVSPVLFTRLEAGEYYITVKHRNHLGIMTASPITLSGASVSVDFTSLAVVNSISGPPNAARRFEGGVYTMWAGDANFNKNSKYNGLSNDKDYVLNALGGIAFLNSTLNGVYRIEDLNLDGKVRFNNTDNDRAVILNTVGVNTPNNIFSQHTPN